MRYCSVCQTKYKHKKMNTEETKTKESKCKKGKRKIVRCFNFHIAVFVLASTETCRWKLNGMFSFSF